MPGRFERLYQLDGQRYLNGCPVLIEAGALLRDRETGTLVCQLKMKNISGAIVTVCKVSVKCFGPDGAEREGVPEFFYMDLRSARGEFFGSRTPIILPDAATRRLEACVTEVVSANGSVWEGKAAVWQRLPMRKTLQQEWNDWELVHQYQLDLNCTECEYVPLIKDGLFLCTCGAVNQADVPDCYQCGLDQRKMFMLLRPEQLKAEAEARIAREEAEEAARIAQEEAEEAAFEEEMRQAKIKMAKKAKRVKKKVKRFLKRYGVRIAIILALVILLVILFAVVLPAVRKSIKENEITQAQLAALEETKQKEDASFQIQLTELSNSIQVGDSIKFGLYEQDGNSEDGREEIEWIVLDKKDNRILVISRYALDCQKYNDSGSDVTWEKSSLRAWLNDSFVDSAFSSEAKKYIPTVIVTDEKANPAYSTDSGNDTNDQVFLLSVDEAVTYLTDPFFQCQPTSYAENGTSYTGSAGTLNGICWWWLRTPGSCGSYATYVNYEGTINYTGKAANSSGGCVRPAMWIDLG